MFNMFFGRKKTLPQAGNLVIAQLNAKLQPIHRGEFFEDPLDEFLKAERIGSVSGGGTAMGDKGEISYCDIEIELAGDAETILPRLAAELERLGAPRGSFLQIAGMNQKKDFGRAEGLGLYLNGTDLADATYANSDINDVIDSIGTLLKGTGRMLSYREGPEETALYFYGSTFTKMHQAMIAFLAATPLCEKCRVVQIA
jgi:hypothetical protein